MRLTVQVGGTRHALDLLRNDASITAVIDEHTIQVESRAVSDGSLLLIRDGKVYDCHVSKRPGTGSDSGAFEINVRGRLFHIDIYDPKRLRGARAAAGHDGGRAEVVAPMPGKVVRVLVAPGQQVEAGDGLVVVEAMKMQNELSAPRAGTVAVLHAISGATVNAGDVLAIVE